MAALFFVLLLVFPRRGRRGQDVRDHEPPPLAAAALLDGLRRRRRCRRRRCRRRRCRRRGSRRNSRRGHQPLVGVQGLHCPNLISQHYVSTGFLKQTALFPPLPPQTASWPLSVGGGGGRRVRKGTGDEGGGGDRGTRGKGRRERERGEREGGGGEGPPRLSPILPSFESFSRLLARIRALTDVGSFCVTTEVV